MKNQLLMALIILVGVSNVNADFAAITIEPGSIAGGTPGQTLGWEFSVTDPIRVTDLGIFDRLGQEPGLIDEHGIGIWDVSVPHQTIVTGLIPSGVTALLIDHFRYISINPIDLFPNKNYVIAAYFPTTEDEHVSMINPGGGLTVEFNSLITPIIRRVSDGTETELTFPALSFPNSPQPQIGASFRFTTIVPEPATGLVLSIAIMCISMRREAH